MNKIRSFTSLALALSVLMAGCSSDESPFTEGGGASSTGTPSQKAFFILFSDWQPAIFDATFAYTQETVDVTAYVGDRNNNALSGIQVFFVTEWGTLSNGGSCTTGSTGSCSITWTSGSPSEVPSDLYTRFVAYTLGEEEFLDSNKNNTFDTGDFFDTVTGDGTESNDLAEPYLDCNRSGFFESGQDIFINPDADGTYTPADTLFNGPNCSHPSLCGNPITYIWDTSYLDVNTAAIANPAYSYNTCTTQ
ncbi:MAG: Ig-like domain-containing protein [Gammaproteobacteria bacterium]|nr:Ig-like domain-containing protein [Gammaproteobacteria bacterium]